MKKASYFITCRELLYMYLAVKTSGAQQCLIQNVHTVGLPR